MNTFDTSIYGRFLFHQGTLFSTIRRWMRVYGERQALSDLDDRLLLDIGVSRLEAQRETEKGFWQE